MKNDTKFIWLVLVKIVLGLMGKNNIKILIEWLIRAIVPCLTHLANNHSGFGLLSCHITLGLG